MSTTDRVRDLTLVAALAAVVGIAVTWWIYGGGSLWPGLVGNFVASLAAFLLALSWDRRSRHEDEMKAVAQEAERIEKALDDERERRAAEVRRRLSAMRLEMNQLKESVESTLARPVGTLYFLPDLPTGAWDAAAESLGRLIADYKLVADLSTFYDRVRDLRWRLRSMTEAAHVSRIKARTFEPMVNAIAREVADDLEKLLPLVDSQIAKPDVQPVGVVHRSAATVVLRITPSGQEG